MTLLEKNLITINQRVKDMVYKSKRIMRNDTIPSETNLLLELKGDGKSVISDNTLWVDTNNNTTKTLSNATVDSEDGSVIFNGVNTLLNTGIYQSALKNGYTIAIRMFPSDWSNYRGVWGIHYGSNYGGAMQANSGVEGITIFHHNHPDHITVAYEKLVPNRWHTIVFSYSNTGKAMVVIDGTLEYEIDTFGELLPYNYLVIGRGHVSSDRYYKGKISNCIVYDRGLNKEEMLELDNYMSTINGGR